MKRLGWLFFRCATAAIVAAAFWRFLAACAPLPLPGHPSCFACGNVLNGTAAEDPKCWVGPCAPGEHVDAGVAP